MTPVARTSSIALGAVVLFSFIWISTVTPVDDRDFILGILSPDEISNAEVALGVASLNDFKIINNRIQVPRQQKAEYLAALKEGNAVPVQWTDYINRSLEAGFFEPGSVRLSKRKAAREQAFARSLQEMPQIDLAAVEYDELKGGFGTPSVKVCSIQVKQHSGKEIDDQILRNIAQHATTKFAGLTIENISILDLGTGKLFRPNALGEFGGNPLLEAQAKWEDYYRKKIRELLNQYGEIKVGVSVSLDPTLQETSERIQYDPTGHEVESIVNRQLTSYQPQNEGIHNPVNPDENLAQSALLRQALNGPLSLLEVEEIKETKSSQYGREQTTKRIAGLSPTAVKISIGVPESFYGRLAQFRMQAVGESQFEDNARFKADVQTEVEVSIAAAVKTLQFASPANEANASAQVEVYSFPDLDVSTQASPEGTNQIELTPGVVAESSTMIWGLGIACLAVTVLMSVLLFWKPKMIASAGKALDFREVDEVDVAFRSEPQLSLATEPVQQESPQASGSELSELIQRDPSQSAELIKNWADKFAA